MSHKLGSIANTKYVVSPSGPYTTIKDAVYDLVSSGSSERLIVVSPGVYTERIDINLVTGGITIIGLGGPAATTYNLTSTFPAGVKIIGHITVSDFGSDKNGFSISNCAIVNSDLYYQSYPSIMVSNGVGSVEIKNCVFTYSDNSSSASSAIQLQAQDTFLHLTDCVFWDMDLASVSPQPVHISKLLDVSPFGSPASIGCNVEIHRCQFLSDIGSGLTDSVYVSPTSDGVSIKVTDSYFGAPFNINSNAEVAVVNSAISAQQSVSPTSYSIPAIKANDTSTVSVSGSLLSPKGASVIEGSGTVWISPTVFNTTTFSATTYDGTPPYNQILPVGFDINTISVASQATVSTNQDHGLTGGDVGKRVLILGHQNPLVDGVHVITGVPSTSSITIGLSTSETLLFADAILSSMVVGTTGTVTVSDTTGISDGVTITIIGHSVLAFNGNHVISNVTGTTFDITVPSGTTSGGTGGNSYVFGVGTPRFGATNTTGGRLIVPVLGVMAEILSSSSGTITTKTDHGFSVGDLVMVVDHNASFGGGSAYRLLVDSVPSPDTLTLNGFSGTGGDSGVVVRITKNGNARVPLVGPVTLTEVSDFFTSGTSDQYPIGTLFLSSSVPGSLQDVRGMVAPGVSRSLTGTRDVRRIQVDGIYPILQTDDILYLDNSSGPYTLALPVCLEEGARVGRQITIIVNSSPNSNTVSVVSPSGSLLDGTTHPLNSPVLVLDDSQNRTVTLVCVLAPNRNTIASNTATIGSTWAVTSRN